MLVGYVANGATGARYTAVRGQGAWLDGRELRPSATTALDRSVVAITGLPAATHRRGASSARSVRRRCRCATSPPATLDGFLDCLPDQHRPWDYLGGLLVCREAGAVVDDALGRELVIAEPDGRRQPVGAGTPELLDALLAELQRP